MSDSVVCPICDTSFDPSVAGGWCTNPDCGEWQHEETAASVQPDAGDSDASEHVSAPVEDADADGEAADADTDAETVICSACGSETAADANFCTSCGVAVPGEEQPATSAPEALVLEVCGHRIPVGDGDRVGREIRAALLDAGRDDADALRVHREHVRFVRETDGFYLIDLAENPTRLNNRALSKGDREPVGPGDHVAFSDVATATVRAGTNPTD